MTYIVNGCIAFNPADGCLLHIESDESVALPLTAQRLLLVLLDSDGELLSRDELLEKVWDQHGFNGSGNNLNQYLSIIRRNFSKFGCDDFIETIPRVGVRLFESVKIYRDKRTLAPASEITPVPVTRSGNKRQLLLSGMFIFAGIVSVILIIRFFLSVINNSSDPVMVAHELDEGCQLVTFSVISDEALSAAERSVRKYLVMSGGKCAPDVTIYFDNTSSQDVDGHDRTLISFCKKNEEGEEILCGNSYYFKGVIDEK